MSAASASSSSIEVVDDSTLQQAAISFHRRRAGTSGSDSSATAWTTHNAAPEPVNTDFTVLSDGSMVELGWSVAKRSLRNWRRKRSRVTASY